MRTSQGLKQYLLNEKNENECIARMTGTEKAKMIAFYSRELSCVRERYIHFHLFLFI